MTTLPEPIVPSNHSADDRACLVLFAAEVTFADCRPAADNGNQCSIEERLSRAGR